MPIAIDSNRPIRWGILGSGAIATKFAAALASVDDAELVAIASRDSDKAATFGRKFSIPNVLPNYEELVRSDVDVIYVATPHHLHRDHSLLCLENGKAVLCEKPLCTTPADTEILIKASQTHDRFLMEGMWMRFLPAIQRFEELVASGLIGEPRLLRADFSFRTKFSPDSRLFDPNQGGGALLDVGIYPVTLAHMLFGDPLDIQGLAHLGSTGVDEQTTIGLRFAEGRLASLTCATRTQLPMVARLFGTKGSLELPSPFFCPDRIIHYPGGDPDKNKSQKVPRSLAAKLESRLRYPRGELAARTIRVPFTGNGMNYEAEAVHSALRTGLIECPGHPNCDAVAVAKTLAALLHKIG